MRRGMSALALWLLNHLAHRNEPLAGDLPSSFASAGSVLWLWSQLLLAIALGSFRQSQTPAALNLSQLDPVVARMARREQTPATQSHYGQSGSRGRRTGMMLIGFLLSTVVPDVWYFVMGGIVGGVGLGLTLAYRRRLKPMATDGQIHTGQLKDLFA